MAFFTYLIIIYNIEYINYILTLYILYGNLIKTGDDKYG